MLFTLLSLNDAYLIQRFSYNYQFVINGNPVFSNNPKSLPKKPPNCFILCNWVFDNFILVDEPFAKALRSLETCVLVNNNVCEKLISSLESSTTFDESFKVASVPFWIPDFNLISCELENLPVKSYIESFYVDFILKQNKITILSQLSKI